MVTATDCHPFGNHTLAVNPAGLPFFGTDMVCDVGVFFPVLMREQGKSAVVELLLIVERVRQEPLLEPLFPILSMHVVKPKTVG